MEPSPASEDLVERAVFFSDVHVDPLFPETIRALLGFLDRLRDERCQRVFILGDLFNFWVGRGHEAVPGYREVVERLGALQASGTKVSILHGNRDFHLGREIVAASGVEIAPEGGLLRLGTRTVRVAHGDGLCLRDTSYQAMRRVIRSRPARRGFLALPLGARLQVGTALRRQSARSVRAKARSAPESFALSPSAVRRLFRGEVDLAIVGHVHQARRIALEVDGRPRVLFTLGSWDGGNRSYLDYGGGTFALHDGPAAARVLSEPLPAAGLGPPPVAWSGPAWVPAGRRPSRAER